MNQTEGMESPEEGGLAGDIEDVGAVYDTEGTTRDLEDVAVLYDTVKQFGGASEEELTAKFDEHAQSVLSKMESRLEGLNDPFVRRAETLAAKHALYDICFTGTKLWLRYCVIVGV